VQVATPVHATEQVVVFGAGHYVSMVQLASTTAPSNPTPLTSTQAVTVTYQQYRLLRQGDPVGSASESVRPKPATTAAPTVAPHSSGIWAALLVALVVVVMLAVLVGLLAVRRRRRLAEAARSVGDPWSHDGIFAAIGAVDPRELAVEDGGVRGPRPVPSVVPAVDPAVVPALGPAPVSDDIDEAAGTPEPRRSQPAH
jgi:hypothetical protein